MAGDKSEYPGEIEPQGIYTPGNNTVEGQQSTSKKGQAEGEFNSACIPLTLPGDESEKPGEL